MSLDTILDNFIHVTSSQPMTFHVTKIRLNIIKLQAFHSENFHDGSLPNPIAYLFLIYASELQVESILTPLISVSWKHSMSYMNHVLKMLPLLALQLFPSSSDAECVRECFLCELTSLQMLLWLPFRRVQGRKTSCFSQVASLERCPMNFGTSYSFSGSCNLALKKIRSFVHHFENRAQNKRNLQLRLKYTMFSQFLLSLSNRGGLNICKGYTFCLSYVKSFLTLHIIRIQLHAVQPV